MPRGGGSSRNINVIRNGVSTPLDVLNDQRQMDQLMAALALANQQAQNAGQTVYNQNNIAQAQQGYASTQYGLGQDLASLGLQVVRGQQNLAQQGQQNATSLAQQQLSNARYLQGLDQDLAQLKYQRSVNETPSAFTQAKRLYGY